MSQRTLHEIYLEPFRRALVRYGVAGLLGSYNHRLKGQYVCSDPELLDLPVRSGAGQVSPCRISFCGQRPQGSARGGLDLPALGNHSRLRRELPLPVISSDSTADGIEAVIRDHVTGDEIHRTLVLAGRLTGESMDADHLTLPGTQEALTTAVAAANPRTIVMTLGAGPVIMPWLQGGPAVIHRMVPR